MSLKLTEISQRVRDKLHRPLPAPVRKLIIQSLWQGFEYLRGLPINIKLHQTELGIWEVHFFRGAFIDGKHVEVLRSVSMLDAQDIEGATLLLQLRGKIRAHAMRWLGERLITHQESRE